MSTMFEQRDNSGHDVASTSGLLRPRATGYQIVSRHQTSAVPYTHKNAEIEKRVIALAELDGNQLRQQWQQVTASPAPGVSPNLLRLALGYYIQAEVLGDLSPPARRSLAQAARGGSTTQPVSAGTRLRA